MAVEHIIPFKIENNIMIGEEELIDDSCINTGELILDAFKSRPDFIGQVDAMTGEENTFQQMRERSVKCALWLKKIGIQRNDGIVVCTSNHLDTYIPYLATLYVGAVLHVWNINQLINVLDHFKFRPKVIFADYKKASYISTFKKYEPNITSTLIVSMTEEEKEQQKEREENKKEKEKNEEEEKIIPLKSILNSYFNKTEIDEFSCTKLESRKDIAVILFFASTSLTIKHHVALRHAFFTDPSNQQIPDMKSNDIGLWVESLYWNISLLLTVRAILSYVKAVKINIVLKHGNIMSESDVNYFCNAIQKYKVNWIFLKNLMSKSLVEKYQMFNKYDFSALKHIIIGGRQLCYNNYYISFFEIMLEKGIPVSKVYCLPEIGVIAYQRPEKLIKEKKLTEELTKESVRNHRRYSGYVTKNVSVSIFNPITKSPLKLTHIGLIYYKSPSLANFSYLNPINANLMTVTDDDGWFHTDDMGSFIDGDIHILERCRNLIIYKNYFILPIIIEIILRNHWAIKDACVISIDNESDGSHSFAAVELISTNFQITEKELIEYVRSKVHAPYMELHGGIMFTTISYLCNKYPARSVIRKRALNYLKQEKLKSKRT